MSCKLYYKYGRADYYIGEFKDRARAESHWSLIRATLESKLGTGVKPIYVETGKGRAK